MSGLGRCEDNSVRGPDPSASPCTIRYMAALRMTEKGARWVVVFCWGLFIILGLVSNGEDVFVCLGMTDYGITCC